MYPSNSDFEKLAEEIKKSGKSVELTPQDLLIKYFDVRRRTIHVKWSVDKALDEQGLITVPNYKSVWQHEKIKLMAKTEEQEQGNAEAQEEHSVAEVEKSIQDNNTPLIRLLEAANKFPVFVTKNDPLTKAITLMMQNDYSQLPVMNNETSREVDGIISWHSIGRKASRNREGGAVKDYLTKEFTIITNDKPLLDAIEIIKKEGWF